MPGYGIHPFPFKDMSCENKDLGSCHLFVKMSLAMHLNLTYGGGAILSQLKRSFLLRRSTNKPLWTSLTVVEPPQPFLL